MKQNELSSAFEQQAYKEKKALSSPVLNYGPVMISLFFEAKGFSTAGH